MVSKALHNLFPFGHHPCPPHSCPSLPGLSPAHTPTRALVLGAPLLPPHSALLTLLAYMPLCPGLSFLDYFREGPLLCSASHPACCLAASLLCVTTQLCVCIRGRLLLFTVCVPTRLNSLGGAGLSSIFVPGVFSFPGAPGTEQAPSEGWLNGNKENRPAGVAERRANAQLRARPCPPWDLPHCSSRV